MTTTLVSEEEETDTPCFCHGCILDNSLMELRDILETGKLRNIPNQTEVFAALAATLILDEPSCEEPTDAMTIWYSVDGLGDAIELVVRTQLRLLGMTHPTFGRHDVALLDEEDLPGWKAPTQLIWSDWDGNTAYSGEETDSQ